MLRDQEDKKAIVLSVLRSQCKPESPFEALRSIGAILEEHPDALICQVLSGGKTNYSYKAYIKSNPQLAVFVKVCFPFALWNPDRSVHYDVVRVENEFRIMKEYQQMIGPDAPVGTPYFCCDYEGGLKVLGVEWNQADQQLATQFADGRIDHRWMPQLARAIAPLHLRTDYDPDFNDTVRPCMESIFPVLKQLFADKLTGDDPDAVTPLAQSIGQTAFDAMIDRNVASYHSREALVHHDLHAFNILCEADHGPAIAICDWEMAFCGPIGGDAGNFLFYPMDCALVHASLGRKDVAMDLLEAMLEFWDEYALVLREEGGKDEVFLTQLLKDAMGWAGFKGFAAAYLMHVWDETFPWQDVPEDEQKKARAAFGCTALKVYQMGFGEGMPELSYDELRQWLYDTMASDIEAAFARATELRPRRRSTLRARRISDASALEEMACRLSIHSQDRRRSIFDVSLLAPELGVMVE